VVSKGLETELTQTVKQWLGAETLSEERSSPAQVITP
jgi:hypothetical protein